MVLASSLAGCAFVLWLGMPGPARPNVVVIVVDTLRADAVSTLRDNDRTPNIAQLAARGRVFPLAFSHAPMTLPAHTSLFSGRQPFETGVYNNGQPVPEGVPLLAELLHDAGYRTEAVVSLATLWPEGVRLGLDRGFDAFDTGPLAVAPAEDTSRRISAALERLDPSRPFFLFAHLSDPHEPYNEHAPHFDGEPLASNAEVLLDGERVDVVTTSTMSTWEAAFDLGPGAHTLVFRSERPFKLRTIECWDENGVLEPRCLEGELLVPNARVELRLEIAGAGPSRVNLRAWLNDSPPPSELLARYRSEVAAADAAVGELFRGLKARGLWENTLVVLTADHGEALGEHGTIGHVVNLYDELLHVPLIVRLPGDEGDERLELAARGIVRHVDLLPTILECSGLPSPPGASGVSLFERADRLLMAETHPPEAPRALFALRDDDYKLVFDPGADSFEMFQLGPDPLELDDVFRHQGHLRETWELLLRRLASEVEPLAGRSAELQQRLSALGY